MRILGREPALWLAVISAALGLGVSFNLDGLSAQIAALIVAAISAVGAAVTAAITHPIAPPVFTGAVTAVADLLAGYHFHVAQETVGAVNMLVLAVLMLLTRGQVSPVAPTPSGRRAVPADPGP